MTIFSKRGCLECGKQFSPRQSTALFCGDRCRKDFHHRRRARGAEMFDILMHGLHGGGKLDDALGQCKRLADAYRAADDAKRHGRQSWQPIQQAIMNLPLAYGSQGDRR